MGSVLAEIRIGGPPRFLWAYFTVQHFEDRKSTRLNSSHLVISYAVFCLKKKKKNAYAHSALSVSPLKRHRTHNARHRHHLKGNLYHLRAARHNLIDTTRASTALESRRTH